jgi:hypothetical protein
MIARVLGVYIGYNSMGQNVTFFGIGKHHVNIG